MGVELAADGVEMVIKPFEVFLGGDMWEKLVEHMFKRNGEDDETSCRWFARGVDGITCEEFSARNLQFLRVEN